MERLPSNTVLLLIDLQRAIDAPIWAKAGPRNNQEAERTIATLLHRWRETARPVIHVRHDSTEPGSTYRPGQPGHAFKRGFEPRSGETVVGKHTTNAFVGTDLDEQLRRIGGPIVVVGVITNNSVEATVRMAGDLGHNVLLVPDGCFTFARHDETGRFRSAEEVHDMSLANLKGEYCTLALARDILAATS